MEAIELTEELVRVVLAEREVRVGDITHTIKLLNTSMLTLEAITYRCPQNEELAENLEALQALLSDLYLWQKKLLEREKEVSSRSLASVEERLDTKKYH